MTDFASIPARLQSLIQQNGPYSLPAVVHDYLYWMQTCTKEQADRIFLFAMIEHRVPFLTREEIYQGVNLGGSFAWSSNSAVRKNGLIRTLPEAVINPPRLMSWPAYQQDLKRRGVVARAETAVSPDFCGRGSMTEDDALRKP